MSLTILQYETRLVDVPRQRSLRPCHEHGSDQVLRIALELFQRTHGVDKAFEKQDCVGSGMGREHLENTR
ncbi:hypothetical protein CC2G_011817 [Coprinopsis cinerea AmutBmut pab1-1]|nr:hypothetical protein CC2G_011817 [Coprinopsis cinerea AmutBmut pab1-1]